MLELIAEFLLDVLLIGVFYWPGWLFLRVLTLGRYPPRGGANMIRSLSLCSGSCCLW
jgi:hypothetical protein